MNSFTAHCFDSTCLYESEVLHTREARSPIPPCYDRIEVDLTPQSAFFRISGCFIGDSTPMVESVTSSFSVSSRVEVSGLRLIKSGELVLTPSLWSHACNACREIKRYVETEESAKGAYGGRAGCIGWRMNGGHAAVVEVDDGRAVCVASFSVSPSFSDSLRLPLSLDTYTSPHPFTVTDLRAEASDKSGVEVSS